MNEPTRILLAEDEEITAIIIQNLLGTQGFQVTVCADGLAAWECLQADRTGFDAVLLDSGLPRMDGMELLRRIKSDPALVHIPVIMETARDDKESIREGLSRGAYYYLTKPLKAEVLVAVVNAALQQSREFHGMAGGVRQAERLLALLQAGSYRFRDLEEGRLLANYLARACPEPERTIQGLQELLVKAVEHGNLEISYSDKSALVLADSWEEEIQRRLQLPEYRDRYVEVHFRRQPESLQFTIRDQGEGFDWAKYLDFSPERVFDLHGRGIAMARKLSFDQLEYQGDGNTVIATVSLPPPNLAQGS